jgi:hypothetical protein
MHAFRLRRARRDGGARHKRMSYANVAATLALFLALGGGTAWAAHHYLITSTNQIKPSVLKSLRGYRGYRGYRGVAGVAGVAGASGTTGFTSTVPSGKTEVGTWAGNIGASTSSPYYIPVSFNIPLAAKPVTTFVAVGGAASAACPGTVANPQAASGNFCIYEAHLSAATGLALLDPNADGGSTATDVYGTVISMSTGTTGFAYGTWAVTG